MGGTVIFNFQFPNFQFRSSALRPVNLCTRLGGVILSRTDGEGSRVQRSSFVDEILRCAQDDDPIFNFQFPNFQFRS